MTDNKELPKSFQEAFEGLSKLQWFDKKAFMPDDRYDKKFCSFIIALALVYNDLKNIHTINDLLDGSKPVGAMKPTPAFGEYYGFKMYLSRLLMGLINELLVLIQKCSSVVDCDDFMGIIKNINKEGKAAWAELIAVTTKDSQKSKLAKFFDEGRNEIAFHYNQKRIFQGYDEYLDESEDHKKPLISLGFAMQDSRFYFADAAAQGYIERHAENKQITAAFDEMTVISGQINRALWNIVVQFIQMRGFGWREL